MKKEYINPEMQIVKVKTATVLAASGEKMSVSSVTTTTMDASEIFGGSDDSEDW